MNQNAKIIRTHKVPEILGLSKATIDRYASAGILKKVKIGYHASGITVESINALLAGEVEKKEKKPPVGKKKKQCYSDIEGFEEAKNARQGQ